MASPGVVQNGNKTFVILGTDHDLQTRSHNPTFANLVLELCRHYKIDFIAEEANGVEWTHAKQVSSSVGAGWANVDLSLKERELTHLGETWDATLSCDDRFLESRKLFLRPNEEREWVWVARAAMRTTQCCLLICGIVHTLSVSSKLASASHTVFPHYYMSSTEFGAGNNPTEKRSREAMGKLVIRYVPITFDECITMAGELHLGSAEEVWEIVNQMAANEEEKTHTFPNGNILTLRRK